MYSTTRACVKTTQVIPAPQAFSQENPPKADFSGTGARQRRINGGLKRGKQITSAFLDRAVVAVRLRDTGWTWKRIASHLSVSIRTLERYWKRGRAELAARRLRFKSMLASRRQRLRSSSSSVLEPPVQQASKDGFRPIGDDDLLDGPRMRRKLARLRRLGVWEVEQTLGDLSDNSEGVCVFLEEKIKTTTRTHQPRKGL